MWTIAWPATRRWRVPLPTASPLPSTRCIHLQVELISRYRAGNQAQEVKGGIHITINGIAAGLRNTG